MSEQAPVNELHKKLLAITDPKQADTFLSQAYKSLEGTDGLQALEIVLENFRQSARAEVMRRDCIDRGFPAGQLHVVETLKNLLKLALEFDPEKAEYPDVPDEEPSDNVIEMPPGVDF